MPNYDHISSRDRNLIELSKSVVWAVTICVVVDSLQMRKIEKVMDQVEIRILEGASQLIARWKGEPDTAEKILRTIMLAAKAYAEDACGVSRYNGSESDSEIKFDE